MWRWLLIYFALGSSFVHSQQHDAAFEAIADYSVNRDAVFKRHAMFAIVELRGPYANSGNSAQFAISACLVKGWNIVVNVSWMVPGVGTSDGGRYSARTTKCR